MSQIKEQVINPTSDLLGVTMAVMHVGSTLSTLETIGPTVVK